MPDNTPANSPAPENPYLRPSVQVVLSPESYFRHKMPQWCLEGTFKVPGLAHLWLVLACKCVEDPTECGKRATWLYDGSVRSAEDIQAAGVGHGNYFQPERAEEARLDFLARCALRAR